MSDFDFLDKISADDDVMFKRCVRTLLARTFIVRQKERDAKLYEYICEHDHEYQIRTYLSCIGYNLIVDTSMHVVCLVQDDDAADTVGLKRLGLRRFDAQETQLLFVLWEMYLEKVGLSEELIVSMEELTNKLEYYQIDLKLSSIRRGLDTFRKYSLVDTITMEDNEEAVSNYASAMSTEGKLSRNMGITYLNPAKIGSYCLGQDTAKHNIRMAESKKQELQKQLSAKQNEANLLSQKIDRIAGYIRNFLEPDYNAAEKLAAKSAEITQHENALGQLEEALKNNQEYQELNKRVGETARLLEQTENEINEENKELAQCSTAKENFEEELKTKISKHLSSTEQFRQFQQESSREAETAKNEYQAFLDGKGMSDVYSLETENRNKRAQTQAQSELLKEQAEYNGNVSAEENLPCGIEYEGNFRAACNRIQMDDIEEVNKNMNVEKAEYERIFKNEFALRIYRRCQRAMDDMNDINKSLRKLKFATTYRFAFKLISDTSGNETDFAKVLRYGKYLDEKSASDDSQISFDFLGGGLSSVNNVSDKEIESLEENIRLIIAKITGGIGNDKIQLLADYREYMTYDIKFTDAEIKDGSLKKQIGLDSGAWRQIPFTIILAASLSMIYDTADVSVRLFFMDEPFEKMSQNNIKLMIDFFRLKGFQVIFCAADKLDSIGEQCDMVIPVIKYRRDNMRTGMIRFRKAEA